MGITSKEAYKVWRLLDDLIEYHMYKGTNDDEVRHYLQGMREQALTIALWG